MRRAHSLVPAAILLLLVACNSPGGGSSTPSSGGGDQQSDSTAASASASSAAASASSGGGSGNTDVDQVASDLTPPNSTETARYAASGGLIVTWTSTDSTDSLKSYYEGKLGSMGLNILATSDVQGTHVWTFGNDNGTDVAGALSIAPDTSGGGQSMVSLSVGKSG